MNTNTKLTLPFK